jgi:dCMP deaminase
MAEQGQEQGKEQEQKARVRPSWDEYFNEMVQVTATRSPCERLQVGCVFVKENRIISQGYNGFLPGCEHISIVRDGHEQATVHAEQNCLADCAKRGASCAGATAYITHYPCIICTRLLLAGGIKEIRYLHDYKNDHLVRYLAYKMGVEIRRV